MSVEGLADRYIETDVLVVGGGLGGVPAACKAREHGLDVTMIEKAAVARSGNAGMGLDHVICYARDGVTAGDLTRNYFGSGRGSWQGDAYLEDPNIQAIHFQGNLWTYEEMKKLGCTMDWYDGEPLWFPLTGVQGQIGKVALRCPWSMIKWELAGAAKKWGVNVIERTVMVDLLMNGNTVVGCTAVNIRTGEFLVIKAKATILATGKTFRIFESETPHPYKYKMVYAFCPSSGSGDATGAVYRAGGDISNMDITGWTYRVRDLLTMSFGQFRIGDGVPMKVMTWKGKEIRNPSAWRYLQLELAGETPLYYSLEHLTEDFHKRVEVALADEQIECLKVLEDRKFNPKTHRWEMSLHHKSAGFFTPNGIRINEEHESTLKNLFAIGDAATGANGSTASCVGGFLVGDTIHVYIKGAKDLSIDEGQVQDQKEITFAPTRVKDGPEPLELECAIRYACDRYSGMYRSEGKLLEGLRRLGTFRKWWLPKVSAPNPHYILHWLEVRNLLDVAELHLQASLERRENRGNFIRLDYPDSNDKFAGMTVQRKKNEKPDIEYVKMPELKEVYDKDIGYNKPERTESWWKQTK